MRKMKEAAALWNAKPKGPPDNDDSFLSKSGASGDRDEAFSSSEPPGGPSSTSTGQGGRRPGFNEVTYKFFRKF